MSVTDAFELVGFLALLAALTWMAATTFGIAAGLLALGFGAFAVSWVLQGAPLPATLRRNGKQ